MMRSVLCGIVAALSLVAALHFRRFSVRTKDRFFDLFAVAFVIFGVNSVALGLVEPNAESTLAIYLLRLLAFGIIGGAIWQKNRR